MLRKQWLPQQARISDQPSSEVFKTEFWEQQFRKDREVSSYNVRTLLRYILLVASFATLTNQSRASENQETTASVSQFENAALATALARELNQNSLSPAIRTALAFKPASSPESKVSIVYNCPTKNHAHKSESKPVGTLRVLGPCCEDSNCRMAAIKRGANLIPTKETISEGVTK